jgi:hypothetical protein
LKLFLEWGRRIKENGGRGEFKYCYKDFWKCHNVSSLSTIKKEYEMSP